MSKLNIFALFGILFLSSALLVDGTFVSNQTAILAQENEAEVKADIDQENKCKKDTECENENKINNQLNITNATQTQGQPETSPCEDCFIDNMNQNELEDFIAEFNIEVNEDITTLEQLCEYIDQNQGQNQLDNILLQSAEHSINEDQYIALIECLQNAGLDVDFPVPE